MDSVAAAQSCHALSCAHDAEKDRHPGAPEVASRFFLQPGVRPDELGHQGAVLSRRLCRLPATGCRCRGCCTHRPSTRPWFRSCRAGNPSWRSCRSCPRPQKPSGGRSGTSCMAPSHLGVWAQRTPVRGLFFCPGAVFGAAQLEFASRDQAHARRLRPSTTPSPQQHSADAPSDAGASRPSAFSPLPPPCPGSGCRSHWLRGVRAAGWPARPRRG